MFNFIFKLFNLCIAKVFKHNVFVQDSSRLGGGDVPSDNNAAPFTVFWGTDVSLNECKQKFKRFLERFIDLNLAEDERFEGMNVNEPVYMQRLEEVRANSRKYISC